MMLGAWLQTLVAGAADVGIPLPYSPERDDCVALVLLCCFFLSSYVLSHSHKFLLQLGHDFIMHRERASIFATSTGTDMRYLLLLLLQMCVLSGLFLFVCSGSLMPEWIERFPSFWLLGAYVGICVVYLFVKWLLYSFLGWIFFQQEYGLFLDGVLFNPSLLFGLWFVPVHSGHCLPSSVAANFCYHRACFTRIG